MALAVDLTAAAPNMAAQSILTFLFPISRHDLRHIFRRIKARIRRAWREGVVPLGLAAGLATLAAVSLRILLVRQEAVEREDQHLFTQTFGVEQEQRELPYPGVVAGLLGTINSKYEELHCADNDPLPACRRKNAVLDTVTRLFSLAVDPEVSLGPDSAPADGCAIELSAQLRSELLKLWAGGLADSPRRCAWLATARDAMRAIRAGDVPPFARCPQAADGKSPVVHGVGEPACQERGTTDRATTLLSAQLARHRVMDRLMRRIKGPASSAQSDMTSETSKSVTGVAGTSPAYEWDSDAEEAAGIARLLDVGVLNAEAVEDSPVSDAVTTSRAADSGTSSRLAVDGATERKADLLSGAELRQAYFISPDNLLRIWALAGNPMMELPRARLWAAAAYLRPFVDYGAHFAVKTRAYLDVGGNGVVTTECRPLWLGTGKDSTFIGAVCTDLTLDIVGNGKLREQLISNRFLHIEPVTITATDGKRNVELTGLPRNQWHHDKKLLSAAVFSEVDKIGLTPLSQNVRPININDVAAFIVPIRKIDEYSIQALIVSPERPSINWKLLRWTVLVVVGIAGYLAFTVMMGFKKRREEDVQNHLVIFRSTQTGIIETLADGEQIVRANDRAEEILGVQLPKSSHSGDAVSISFTDIYDLAVEVVDDPWPDARDGGDTDNRDDELPEEDRKKVEYRVLSPADIFARRFEGGTTRHWIHLRNRDGDEKENPARSWVSIQVGPLMRQTGNYLTWLLRSWLVMEAARLDLNKSVGAFGTVDRASRRRATELDGIREQWEKEKADAQKAKRVPERVFRPKAAKQPSQAASKLGTSQSPATDAN